MAEIFLSLAVLAYFAASAVWIAFFLAQREGLCRWGVLALAGGWGAQTLALALRALALGRLPMATLGEALLILSWALVATFLVLYWRLPIKVLGTLAAPLAALMVSGGLILPGGGKGEVSPHLSSFWVHLHAVLTFLGVAALTLAGLSGLLYLIQERDIKRKKFGFFYRRLPSLTQLDRLNHLSLAAGFPLLTLGLISGSLYAQYTMGRFFNWDPKEILAVTGWLVYAVLLHERLTVGWRGRRAAWLALTGLTVLAVTFVGANLWFGGYHSFSRFSGQP
jgi:cytochrome c-type biogenesis protein CcsB